ncbi:MAG: hypothetical protein C4558_06330 [Dehalococcoidia bacterium]|nr:MAG: hypothetical protein C4558_06330 [Dehalococcoidia bacterium]
MSNPGAAPITVTVGPLTFSVDPETQEVLSVDGDEDDDTPYGVLVERALDRVETIARERGIVCGRCLGFRCECPACPCGVRSFAREMHGLRRTYRCRQCGTVEVEALDVAAHCDGCDDDQRGVRAYEAEHESGEIVVARWCPDCADTAAVWAVTGEHDGLHRVWSPIGVAA